MREFERKRGFTKQVVASLLIGAFALFIKLFPRGWWQMERIPLFHLDLCWRVISYAAYSSIHLSLLVC